MIIAVQYNRQVAVPVSESRACVYWHRDVVTDKIEDGRLFLSRVGLTCVDTPSAIFSFS